jgi:pyruvate/2-oxoglutarate dehydrogenase complex dihydrolipoamide acyltransferase (E2) component
VIDRVRELLDRPIADAERPRLFWLAGAILVTSAIALIALGPTSSDEGAPSAPPPATAPNPPPPPTPVAPVPPPVPPAAERSARRFLAGYLRFIYGCGRAEEIEAAAPALRRRLARTRLRVSPAARRRRPRVTGLDAQRLVSGAVAVTAEVADGGVARYRAYLELRRAGGRWTVVEAGSD